VIIVSACAASVSAEHYRVYLLGGQSNANGRGDAAKLTEPLALPQTDVRFYWHRTQKTENAGWLAEDKWIDLAPGSGHGITKPAYPKEFGPEITFGRTMADAHPDQHIAIIKYAHGGTSLFGGWSAKGPYYRNFVATVKAGLAALEEEEHTYELAGMLWQQGENDCYKPVHANAYEQNLTNLIDRVRTDLFDGAPAAFVVGGLFDNQPLKVATPGSNGNIVRKAQENVAKKIPMVGFVNTDGFSVKPADKIHLSAEGQLELGKGFARQMLALEARAASDSK
jgi:iduronate 2-sulfatase